MPTLIIQDDAGTEIHRSRVREVEEDLLIITVLKSIREIPLPRKPRRDIGTERGPRKPKVLPPAANPPEPEPQTTN